MEIPCPTFPTRSHFIQDKSKISIYLYLDKYNVLSQYNSVFHILINYYELTSCIENGVDPDKLASSDLHCFQEKPADQDPYCFQELIYIWFHIVFGRIIRLSTERYIKLIFLPLDKLNFL